MLDTQGRTVRVLPVPISVLPTDGLAPGLYVLHTPAGDLRFVVTGGGGQ